MTCLTEAAQLGHDIKRASFSFSMNRATHTFFRPTVDDMKTSFTTLLSSVLLLVGSATAAAPPKYPQAPGLTYLYQVNITGGEAAVVGKGPRGVRIVVPILFGSFEGPRLKGELSERPTSKVGTDVDTRHNRQGPAHWRRMGAAGWQQCQRKPDQRRPANLPDRRRSRHPDLGDWADATRR
jgi:hypothetical protein